MSDDLGGLRVVTRLMLELELARLAETVSQAEEAREAALDERRVRLARFAQLRQNGPDGATYSGAEARWISQSHRREAEAMALAAQRLAECEAQKLRARRALGRDQALADLVAEQVHEKQAWTRRRSE